MVDHVSHGSDWCRFVDADPGECARAMLVGVGSENAIWVEKLSSKSLLQKQKNAWFSGGTKFLYIKNVTASSSTNQTSANF